MYLASLCLPVEQELGRSVVVPSRTLQELFPPWTLVQGMFFVPALDLGICLTNAELTALRTWLAQMIQVFSV